MSIFLSHIDPSIKLAAPSWVIPGTVAENCRYLAGKVDEVGLLFFETESCLNYSSTDLPQSLADTDLSFHIHHPLDLPWDEGGETVAEVVGSLIAKAAHLDPVSHVIHPPESGSNAGALISSFRESLDRFDVDPEILLFENIQHNSLSGLVDHIRDCGFRVCLDLGHILAYEQQAVLDENLAGLVKMLHLNAPGRGGRHESLLKLDDAGLLLLGRIMDKLEKSGTITIEVFEEKVFFESLSFLNEYCSYK